MIRLMAPFPLFVAVALAAMPAFGHARLVRSSPGAGQVLGANPAEIHLTFNEPIELALSDLSVEGNGEKFEAVSGEGQSTEIVLHIGILTPGDYEVNWHALSADAHQIEGSFGFTLAP